MTATYDFDAIVELMTQLLMKAGLPEERARRIARVQTEVEGFGVTTHGLTVAAAYVNIAKGGNPDPDAKADIIREFGGTAVLDGGKVMGVEAVLAAREEAEKRAREHGVGLVSVLHAGWVGVLGYHLAELARKGFLCRMWAQMSGYPCVVPFGGREGRVSTSPLAIVMPNDPDPVVADFSTSAVASGKVYRWRSEGVKAPEPLFYNAEGELSDDPQVFCDHKAMLPLGGASSGFRGTAFSIWGEAMTAAAGGIASGGGKGGQNFHLLAIHADALGDVEAYKKEWQRFAEYMLSSKPAKGMSGPRFPGQAEWKKLAQAQSEGLCPHPDVISNLEKLAEELGVEMPEAK
ncbi:MAG: Ldh family oxidoreductase [Candidatus Sumerlaeia bacterium]